MSASSVRAISRATRRIVSVGSSVALTAWLTARSVSVSRRRACVCWKSRALSIASAAWVATAFRNSSSSSAKTRASRRSRVSTPSVFSLSAMRIARLAPYPNRLTRSVTGQSAHGQAVLETAPAHHFQDHVLTTLADEVRRERLGALAGQHAADDGRRLVPIGGSEEVGDVHAEKPTARRAAPPHSRLVDLED